MARHNVTRLLPGDVAQPDAVFAAKRHWSLFTLFNGCSLNTGCAVFSLNKLLINVITVIEYDCSHWYYVLLITPTTAKLGWIFDGAVDEPDEPNDLKWTKLT